MARTHSIDPRRLDVAAFAKAAARLDGQWPQADMPRLQQDLQRRPAPRRRRA
jgi:hypothetical protein